MGEKVTWMVLKADLKCQCCYKKVKKILCKFPQIRDQVYDEQKNLVKITVVCCSPEKIRDKLCCKGKKVIQSIEIIEIKPTEEPEKCKDKRKPDTVPPPPKGPQGRQPIPEIPRPPPLVPVPAQLILPVPVGFCCPRCYDGYGFGPCYHGCGRPPPPRLPAPPCCDTYYGYGKVCYVSRCDDFSEENTSACTIM